MARSKDALTDPAHAGGPWKTALTLIERNRILVRGYPIDELMGRLRFGETIYLMLTGDLPRPSIGLLVDAMLVEHQLILGLVGSLRSAGDRVHAAAEARALAVTFDSHLAKENDQILPLLAGKPDVSLADANAEPIELTKPKPKP